jgi:pimeloyl-ACP methyl ester carboxylesterase
MSGQLLDVPGARIYHEVAGAGPVLLLVPGGSGDAAGFGRLVRPLAARYTVVSYDRRGFSRSPADGATPDTGWLAQDVTDALALLDRYSPDGPALAFGSSSGAIVGLELLARHGKRVRTLIAHEPPLLDLLPEAAAARAFVDEVYDTALREGAEVAMRRFNRHVGIPEPQLPPPDQLPPPLAAMLRRIANNTGHFLRYELRQYTAHRPDLAALERHRDRLVLAGGRDSRTRLPYQPNLILARRLGLPVVDLPGDHIGYIGSPIEFAAALDTVLSGVVTG